MVGSVGPPNNKDGPTCCAGDQTASAPVALAGDEAKAEVHGYGAGSATGEGLARNSR